MVTGKAGGGRAVEVRGGVNGGDKREGKEMKCTLFPGSIINTVINEHRDRGKDGNDKV